MAIPSFLKSLDSAKYSSGAIKELKRQLKTTVSPKRAEQINLKILEHNNNIKKQLFFQISNIGLKQIIKNSVIETDNE